MVLIGGIGAAEDAAETGPGTTSSSQITQTISLEPGWNSVSFKVPDLSFDQDIKPQCSFNWYNQQLADGTSSEEIENDERYHVWAQRGGEWSHPDDLEVSEGYSFNVGSECEIEVSGERERVDSFELEDGWNLVNVPSGLALGQIKEECNLRWYNQDLSNVDSADEISQSDRYYFWVNDGNSWRNPLKQDDHRGDDGVYINSDGACQISSWPYDGKEPDNDNENYVDDDADDFVAGDLYFWDTEAETGLVNSEAGSDESAELEYNMYDGSIVGQFRWNNPEEKEYTIWMKNQNTGESAQASKDNRYINFPSYSQTFETDIQYDLYRLSEDGCTDFRLAILPGDWDGEDSDVSSDSYQSTTFTFCPFNRDEDSSDGSEDDTDSRCDADRVWSPWLEECIDKDDDVESGLNQIEDTEWSIETEGNTIHTLDDLSIESDDDLHNLMFHTGYQDGVLADHGQTGWCGNMYFETSSLETGLATFNIEMIELQNTEYGAEQDTQTPYIIVNEETIYEEDDGHISPGESDQVSVELEEGDNVKIGLEDTDLGCGGYAKRTKAIIEVDTGNSAYDYSLR
jgi:hypothetical protein